MKAGGGHSMSRLLSSVSLFASFAALLCGPRAVAQTPDGGARMQEDGAQAPEAGVQAPEAGAAAPVTSDVEAGVAAEMAAIQSQSVGYAYASEQAEHRRIDIYGFADFGYMRYVGDSLVLSPSPSSFSVGNLNLYLAGDLGDEWRSLVEVRFMYLPNGALTSPTLVGPAMDTKVYDNNDFGRPVQWGGIHIERVWLERTFHKLLTVRVGHWLTPYGIWNVDHGSPVVIGVGRPFIVGEELFPASQTGIEIYGAADIDNIQLGYHLTLSNGRGPASSTCDFDDNKAIGGRLYLRYESAYGTFSLGTAAYRGQYTNKHTEISVDAKGTPAVVSTIDAQYDELSLSGDLKWQWGGLLAQAEVIENEVAFTPAGRTASITGAPAFDSDYRRWGAYGLAGYRFAFLGVMPYAGVGYYKEGSSSLIPKLWDYWVGLNLRPTPRVVLKLQYTNVHFYVDPQTQDARMLAAQAAWSF
jgi:hypothetical protein